jgi:murein tripeptide amidase MpaA
MARRIAVLWLALLAAVLTAQPDPAVWKTYHNYDSLTKALRQLQRAHPDVMSLRSLGTSVQGRHIWLVTITNRRTAGPKPAVLFDGGLHGTEAIGTEAMLRYVRYLIASGDESSRKIVDGWITYIIPLLNPDGVTAAAGQTDWRKVRRNAHGVDLNRNFDWSWDSSGSTDGKADTFHGQAVFSEPESRVLRDFIKGHKLSLYLNGHSGTDKGPYLIVPQNSLDEERYVAVSRIVEQAGDFQTVRTAKAGEAFLWAYWKGLAPRRTAAFRPLTMLLEIYTVGTIPQRSRRWWERYNPPARELEAVCGKVRRVLVGLTLSVPK